MYRPNVGICIINSEGKIFGGKRVERLSGSNAVLGQSLWQMPQGGVSGLDNESVLIQEMYRELWEEVGLCAHHVKVLGLSSKIKYDFSQEVLNFFSKTEYSKYKGQEQIWVYLKFLGKDLDINLNNEVQPEFSDWKWVSKEFLLQNVIEMKKFVYKTILNELDVYCV